MNWIRRITNHPIINKLTIWLKRVTLPGFRGMSLFDVGKFFLNAMWDEDLNLRSSSLAFNFFLALFPLIIFFFTIIAYIPIAFLHQEILQYLSVVLPHEVYSTLLGTIEDILKNQHGSLLSFGFLAALYFGSNAFISMMQAFHKYEPEKLKRGFLQLRIRGIGLTFLISLIFVLTVAVITYAQLALYWIQSKASLDGHWLSLFISWAQYISVFLLVYFSISSMFYFGSARSAHWRFFSPGSTLASILSLVTSWAFAYYVNQFNSYNKLYGSIGAIIAFMVLIYVNSLVLLIGFELNSSIDRAEAVKEER